MANDISQFRLLRNLGFFFMIGFLLYSFFPFPPIIWRLGLVGVSTISIIVHLTKYEFPSLEQGMILFVLLITIHFFISFIWRTPDLTNFGNVLCSILPVSLFFVVAAKSEITERTLTIFLILSCIAGYFYFIHAEKAFLEQLVYREAGELTINASTVFLVIIPFLFFVRKKWVTIGVSVVIIFFIIYGSKRGNIVSVIPPFYLLIRMNLQRNKSFTSELLLILLVLAFAYFAYYQMTNNDFLMKRIEDSLEGDSSNRDIIYANALNAWQNAPNPLNLFFGFGADGTVSQIGIRAHNDWLEILVDYGIVGVFCYLAFFIFLIKAAWRNKKNTRLFYALLAVFFIWFSKSLYSMGFTNDLFSFLSAVIGIVLGLEYRQKRGLPIYIED